VRPTRLGTLALVALVLGALSHLLASTSSYGTLPVPTAGAPVALLVLAACELALAQVVRDRVQHRLDAAGRPPRRALHPLQVARAAALAKASSLTGAVVTGVYGGLFTWSATRSEGQAGAGDAPVAGAAALAGVALVVSALLLERACRVPDPPDDDAGLGSDA
jgi:hypothetical protein